MTTSNNDEELDVNALQWLSAILPAASMAAAAVAAGPTAPADLGKDGYVDSNGVKIHYVEKGSGPLVVMIHGFPDFWYTWREQIPELSKHFHVVAIDQRGYNLSDKPEGVENYRLEKLVADVDAVVDHFKAKKAVIVGHDWGGMVAWTYAMQHPDKMDRLVILNLPHPRGLMRTGPQSRPAKGEWVRSQLPAARRREKGDRRHADFLGARSSGQGDVRRGVQTLVYGGDAQLLQGELSASTLQRDGDRFAQGQMPRAHDSRTEGCGPVARRSQRDLELD